jgi:hypothetical protein
MTSMPLDEETYIVASSTLPLGAKSIEVSAEPGVVALAYSPLPDVVPWIISDGTPAEARRIATALLTMADEAEAAVTQ